MSTGPSQGPEGLDKATIERLLKKLNDKLAENDRTGEIYVVGGAALILEYGAARRTSDVDCMVLREPDAVHAAAAEIMQEEAGLAPDWLNETAAAAHKIPDETDENARTSFTDSHLTVRSASPEWLVAMKLHAGREHDYQDVRQLLRDAGINSGEDAKRLTEYHFPHTTVADDVVARIDEMIQTGVKRNGEAAPERSTETAVEPPSPEPLADGGTNHANDTTAERGSDGATGGTIERDPRRLKPEHGNAPTKGHLRKPGEPKIGGGNAPHRTVRGDKTNPQDKAATEICGGADAPMPAQEPSRRPALGGSTPERHTSHQRGEPPARRQVRLGDTGPEPPEAPPPATALAARAAHEKGGPDRGQR